MASSALNKALLQALQAGGLTQDLFRVNAPQLRNIPFNPEGAGYDYETAVKYGMAAGPDAHWGSRVELDRALQQALGLPEGSGIMLKGATHPTWDKALMGEDQAGFRVIKGPDGRYYSVPK